MVIIKKTKKASMSSQPPVTVTTYCAGISSSFMAAPRQRLRNRPPPPSRRRHSPTLAQAFRNRPRRRGDPDAVPDDVVVVDGDNDDPVMVQDNMHHAAPQSEPVGQIVPVQPVPPPSEQPVARLPDGGFDFMGISQPYQRPCSATPPCFEPQAITVVGGHQNSPFRLTYKPSCCGEGSNQAGSSTPIAPIARYPFREQLSRPYYSVDSLQLAPFIPSTDVGSQITLFRPPVFVIRVKSFNKDDNGVLYNMRQDETFDYVYQDYAAKVDRAKDEIQILKDVSNVIASSDTPQTAGLLGDATVFVRALNPDYNVDTRFKQFFLRGVLTFPEKVRVEGWPNDKLGDIIEEWGKTRNLPRSHVQIIYEEKTYSSVDTVAKAGIKNEFELFLMPNILHTTRFYL